MKITDIKGSLKLNNGVNMPYFGLGTFEAKDGPEVKNSIHYALDAGYRLIDTAAFYENEKSVGEAIRENDVNRKDIFVTTKLWTDAMDFEQALKAYDQSLEKLGMDYVDLYLIHWPVTGKFIDAWKALEKIYKEGRVKAIGISNFLPIHLKQLLPEVEVMPSVNQMEFHPYLIQQELLDLCAENKIVYQAWSPIMQGRVFDIPLLKQIGRKYRKNQVQVVLRWDLQRGVATIPKSVNQARIEANANIFDFELSDFDMKAINALDKNHRFGYDPMMV
ncbi:MAG: aldo/keto reductase [Prolixibacteraceae bacterium]|jgi:diketogulonate reductase-like aldo/keto reductase|nr:aldo/keto reductase [Prolixibacteraceae bacterium]